MNDENIEIHSKETSSKIREKALSLRSFLGEYMPVNNSKEHDMLINVLMINIYWLVEPAINEEEDCKEFARKFEFFMKENYNVSRKHKEKA